MTTYDDAFIEVMGRNVGDTELKMLDLYLLGEAVLNSVGSCIVLGHSNPANTVLDYTAEPTDTDHVSKHILRDLLAWQSGRKAAEPRCESRLRAWIEDEWLPHQMANVSNRLTG